MADIDQVHSTYQEQGFVSQFTVLDTADAAVHRSTLEKAEAELGPLHYINKIHTVMASAYELATHPTCLLYTSPSPRDQRGPRMPSSA